eukprot:TRINITY_DN14907_c0_g1_i1.p1 TRINITY_DN14907_c0_g1~~TRINITY_DN14907_c0_g1_i1.p1  ORF type:complete len:663 (+),score=202.58 TRINITY_DN14907_c0_g1_i1:135-2123(+)
MSTIQDALSVESTLSSGWSRGSSSKGVQGRVHLQMLQSGMGVGPGTPVIIVQNTHNHVSGSSSVRSSSTSNISVGGRWATTTTTKVETHVHTVSSAQPPPPRPRLKWRKGACVGQGGFGKVFIGLNEDTGELLAVKVIDFQHYDQKIAEKLTALQSEIKVMRDLKHPNIVRYIYSERVGSSINIFMEYVPGGSIASLLKLYGKLNEGIVSMYTRDITRALQYLHNHDVVHRDIKAANVLLNVKGDVKLADFGSALWLKEQKGLKGKDVTHGTPRWMSPEVITSSACTTCSDIWSLGCTILEMLTAKEPWHHISSNNCLSVMRYVGDETKPITLPPDLDVSPECESLVRSCLVRDPQKRLTTLDILKHPFNDKPDPYAEEEWDGDSMDSSHPGVGKSPEDTVLTEYHAAASAASFHRQSSSEGPEAKYAPSEDLIMALEDRKGSRKRLKILPMPMFSPGLVQSPSLTSNPLGPSVGTLSPTASYATEIARVPSLGRGSTYRTNPVRASKNMPPEQQKIAQCLISSCLSINGIDFDEDDMETIISGRTRVNLASRQGSPNSTVLPVREMSLASLHTEKHTGQEIQDCVMEILARNLTDQKMPERHVLYLDADFNPSSSFRYTEKTISLCGRKFRQTSVCQAFCVACLVLVIMALIPLVLLQRFK